jgi:hypothetical protein
MEEALPLWRQVGHRFGLASALYSLARLERDGNPRRAAALLRESLTLYRQLNNDRGLALVLCSLADLCEHGGQAARAARLLAAAGRLAGGLGPGQPVFDHDFHDAVLERLRLALGDTRLARELARGTALTPDEVQALALE